MPDDGKLFDIDEVFWLREYYRRDEAAGRPFQYFDTRFSALLRYFYINVKVARQFIVQSEAARKAGRATTVGDSSPDSQRVATLPDVEYHVDFLYASVLTQLYSLYESVLLGTVEMLRTDLQLFDVLAFDKAPITDRYVNWLRVSAGCDLDPGQEVSLTLAVLREIRNSFMSAQIRQAPHLLAGRPGQGEQESPAAGLSAKENYVYKAFETTGKAVKAIELAVIKRLHEARR